MSDGAEKRPGWRPEWGPPREKLARARAKDGPIGYDPAEWRPIFEEPLPSRDALRDEALRRARATMHTAESEIAVTQSCRIILDATSPDPLEELKRALSADDPKLLAWLRDAAAVVEARMGRKVAELGAGRAARAELPTMTGEAEGPDSRKDEGDGEP